jgi:type III secretion system YscQ/HrcQ family protein
MPTFLPLTVLHGIDMTSLDTTMSSLTPGSSAVRFRPFSMPRLTTPMTTLMRLQSRAGDLKIGAEEWRIRLAPTAGLCSGPLITAAGAWLGHYVALHFPEALLQRTLQVSAPHLTPTSIPVSLFSAVAASAIGVWLSTLPDSSSLRIDTINANDPDYQMGPDASGALSIRPDAKRLYLLVHRQLPAVDTVTYTIAIDTDPALTDALPGIFSEAAYSSKSVSERLRDMPIPLYCEIGRETFSRATLEALHPGDILFFTRHTALHAISPAIMAVRLRHQDHTLMQANIQSNGQMVITQINMNYPKSFSNDEPADVAASAEDSFFTNPDSGISDMQPDDFYDDGYEDGSPLQHLTPTLDTVDRLAQLPMQVIFDVGTCEMVFADLQRLEVGHVLPVASGALELVRVTVNGRVIGRGELVNVDGKIGVLLTRLS